MFEDLRPRLTDAVIRRSVGDATFRRGAAYAREGRVSLVVHHLDEVSGQVAGQGGVYRTVAEWGGDAARWWGECSCPVGDDCKHVAALLLVAREALPGPPRTAVTATPDWERALAPLVAPAPSADQRGTSIGLQFEVSGTGPRRAVRLRPVVPGARGRWIRSGVSWRTLEYGSLGRRDPDHAGALTVLYRAHQLADGGAGSYGYWSGEPPVLLDDFGPELWPALRQVAGAGVPMLTSSGAPVRLAGGPARLAVDLRYDDTALRIRPVLALPAGGDLPLPADEVGLLGDPPHGAVLASGAPGLPAGLVPDGGLLLVPLDRVDRRAAPLFRGPAVTVPRGDVDRFLADFYPAVRRTVAVGSSDGSVALPEVLPPRLCLQITHAGGHRATSTWSVLYRVGEEDRRLPWAGGAGAAHDPVRDPSAEERLVRQLPDAVDRVPGLCLSAAPRRRLVPTAQLQGMDTVVLATEVVPALCEAGVVVEVTGDPPDYRHTGSSPVVHVSATDGADNDWFDLGVTVTVDDEEVPFALLFVTLAAGESHLVLPSGTWFDVRRPEFDRLRRLIDEARDLQDADGPGLRISRYQAGLWEELVELGVVAEQSERWARDVQGLLGLDTATPPPVPAGLDAQLRPYQLEGLRWLACLWDAGLGGVLADDMGLGKTLQTLAVLCRAQEAGTLTAPVLVVAPTSVVSNWAREAARFAPGLTVRVVESTGRKLRMPLAEVVAGADLVITTYTLLRLDEGAYGALPWSGLVLDEAQFVKNHTARTYAAARRLPARFKLAITGTPLENSLMDLWSMLSIVAPGLFPDPKRFTEHYRTPIERGGDPAALETLRRRIRPLVLRRTKEQVAAELPPKQEQVLEVVLDPRHRKVYDTHLQRERRTVLGLVDDLQKNRFTIFRSLTLLRQLALDPALVDDASTGIPSSKADAFLEHVQEVVSEGHRVLVFSQFTRFLRTVRDRLDAHGVAHAYLDGRTRDRAQRIEEFRSGRAPVFLISLKAGGSGLNLTEADYVYVLDPWWNPAVEAQAIDRAHRIGQDRTVMVYRLVAADTIEEKVVALQERKRDLFARVLDDDGALTGPLTADDIRGLFS
ncbi:superfamily II DNA or RNA helicase [Geodermatophilus bullaregiensis]|uniref:DEAD/DEAH box helicase n=1 Tax=Geodermatophilus bullaregiensis TaxID=1564160 RepID=UPI00195B8DB5|nr:DEAD/DEAH box helicase [Geodermatophilus bullaregiensis]MBM7806555.1 superfamily II DNA or RNA helicase [Geodermatophilus bullaregiensis]